MVNPKADLDVDGLAEVLDTNEAAGPGEGVDTTELMLQALTREVLILQRLRVPRILILLGLLKAATFSILLRLLSRVRYLILLRLLILMNL